MMFSKILATFFLTLHTCLCISCVLRYLHNIYYKRCTNEVLCDWKVCLLNTYTWYCHLKSKAMSIVNFSDRQKTSKWQKKGVLVSECILRYPLLSYTYFPQYAIKVYYMRVPCFLCEIQVVHNIDT